LAAATDRPLHPCPPAGKPLFGTLIALLEDGVPILGIIDQPILKERWLGCQGRASTLNGKWHQPACPAAAAA
jgi:fructose-1,6-bisphosphatase/inositol monophosphatase family enzyme